MQLEKFRLLQSWTAKTYRKLIPLPQPTLKPQYGMNDTTLIVNHSGGVFSCYTIRLEAILDYYRTYNRLPSVIDSSQQFTAYKDDLNEDISNKFFEESKNFQLTCNEAIYLTNQKAEQQFSDYSKLNFLEIKPFVEKYFMPAENIRERIKHFEGKMAWDYESICGIRYRGTDKNLETNQPPYAEMILKAVKLKRKFPHIKFLLQTDEKDFLDYAMRELEGECYFHIITPGGKLENISDYVAAIFIFSRCKYLITTSGNGELWIRILRGNNRGSIQWLSPKEYIYGIKNESFDPNEKCFWIDSERIIS
jgi:hypothetical protein